MKRHTDCTGRKGRGRRGFTLVEIMIASLIALLVLAAVIGIQLMSARTVAEGSADARLERLGNLVMEKIVRGPTGQYGLREARLSTVTVVTGSTPSISFMVDRNDPPTFDTADDTACSIYLNPEGTVIYDPDVTLEGDEIELNNKPLVKQMTITQYSDCIGLELVLEETVQPFDAAIQVRVDTIVQPRLD